MGKGTCGKTVVWRHPGGRVGRCVRCYLSLEHLLLLQSNKMLLLCIPSSCISQTPLQPVMGVLANAFEGRLDMQLPGRALEGQEHTHLSFLSSYIRNMCPCHPDAGHPGTALSALESLGCHWWRNVQGRVCVCV